MKKLSAVFAVAALATVSMTASAWWGGPWDNNGYGNGFGDGYADGGFSFNLSARGRGNGYGSGYGRGYDYYGGPYHGYPYAPTVVAPLSEEQQEAMAAQQKAAAEQQAKAFQEALEAQRKYSEQFATGNREFPAPYASGAFPVSLGSNFSDRDIRRQEMIRQMDERRSQATAMRPENRGFGLDPRHEEMRQQMEERRNSMASRAPRPTVGTDSARRDEMRQQMQQRHDEMMKRVEAQRKYADEQQAAMRKTMEERRVKTDI